MSKLNFRLYGAAAVMVSLVSLASCSDDNKEEPAKPEPVVPQAHANGVFVLNQGQFYNSIEGSLNFIDFNDNEVYNNLFSSTNRRSLGDTPQCGVQYGSKIYIGVSESSTIEVIDANTYVSIKQLKLDESTGTQPRALIPHEGKIYASMFDGYVARLDTTTLSVEAKVKVGPNPETPAILNGKMFVPNSDGMNWAEGYGTTASIIDMASFTVSDTVEVPLNPERFLVSGSKLYLLSKGDYGTVDAAIYEIDPDIALLQKEETEETALPAGCRKITTATIACTYSDGLYLIDAPFNKTGVLNYYYYEVAADKLTQWYPSEVVYPTMVGVDSKTGNIVIASLIMDGVFPSYITPGFAAVYSPSRAFIKKYDVGAGPAAIF